MAGKIDRQIALAFLDGRYVQITGSTMTGALNINVGGKTLTLTGGSITDSSGAISFGDETIAIGGATTINTNSTTALLVEQDGVKDNVLVVDTTNGRVGINGIPTNYAFEVYDITPGYGGIAGPFIFYYNSTINFWRLGPTSAGEGIYFQSGIGVTAFDDMCRIGSPNNLNERIDITGDQWLIDGWYDDTTRRPILFPSTITVGSAGSTAGVNLSGVNGILTLLGAGTGADENLVIDFNTTANNVIFTSTTGVTQLNFSALNLLTTGTLGAGAITGTSLTDGTATLDDGSLTGAVNGTFSGTVQVEHLYTTDDLQVADDILLGSGSVLNWNSGDITLTHSANTLTFAGETILDFGICKLTQNGTKKYAKIENAVSTEFLSVVSTLTLSYGGESYIVGDVLLLSGGGNDCYIKVVSVGESGEVATWTILEGGTGYAEDTYGAVGGHGESAEFAVATLTSDYSYGGFQFKVGGESNYPIEINGNNGQVYIGSGRVYPGQYSQNFPFAVTGTSTSLFFHTSTPQPGGGTTTGGVFIDDSDHIPKGFGAEDGGYVNLGVNVPQYGTQNPNYYGGLFRFIVSPSFPMFVVHGYTPAGAQQNHFVVRLDDGNTYLGGLSGAKTGVGYSLASSYHPTINYTLDVNGDAGIGGQLNTQNVYPLTDNTYYLGKNDDDTPKAYKGVILKDTTNGKYYRIEIINGTITATDLTD